MIISYYFSEKPDSTFSDRSPFCITDKTQSLAKIFRVLSGSCLIFNANHDEPLELHNNYFYGDFRPNETGDLSFLDSFEENTTLEDYEAFVLANQYKNHKFYSSFLNEISGSVYHEELEHHTAAFVHIYRAYEHMSYAFPMIYASKTTDYIATFDNLRKWLSHKDDGNVGELKFHKSFITTLFKDMPELSSTIDINILSKDEFKEGIFSALVRKVLGWKTIENYTASTVKPEKISVPFPEFHSFIVTLRNRYFHYNNSNKDNIGINDIIESDLLFSFVNQAALNYISTIFNGIVKQQM
jgi:hypothetical protein